MECVVWSYFGSGFLKRGAGLQFFLIGYSSMFGPYIIVNMRNFELVFTIIVNWDLLSQVNSGCFKILN